MRRRRSFETLFFFLQQPQRLLCDFRKWSAKMRRQTEKKNPSRRSLKKAAKVSDLIEHTNLNSEIPVLQALSHELAMDTLGACPCMG